MDPSERTCKLLTEHFQKYPDLQITDIFKYIFQSSFGCEHMVSSLDFVTDYIRSESESCVYSDRLTDQLDGAYSRVHFSYLKQGLGLSTLAKLFFLSAKSEPDGKNELLQKLKIAREMVSEGKLPFTVDEFDTAVKAWKAADYPAVHHSEVFREKYKPSYRVVADKYVTFLPIFAKIDKALENGNVILAIEGGSAAGKSTLGEMLESIYDCTVFHMDDFFLRPEQRTKERFAEVGGNVDRERFLEEVLIPLSRGESVNYRRFDCSTFTIKAPELITPKRLTVIEGAYSMHPELADFYDVSVFLDVSEETQKKRIEKRNSKEMAKRFFNEWIPLERTYFEKMQVKERCDICVEIE